MAGRSKEDPRTVRNRLIWEDASAWIGRIFAVMLFMVGPGAAGVWLDRHFGTKFLAPIGFVLGMALGTTLLLILVSVKRPGLDEELSERLGESDSKISDSKIAGSVGGDSLSGDSKSSRDE